VSSGSARLFVALALPAAVRAALEAWRRAAVDARRAAGLRVIDPGALHVTLCFLGSRPVAEIEAIASACASALVDQRPMSLTLGEALWLPPRRPGVLAVRLHDTGERLAAVQAGLASALRDGGWYEPERRAFLPHVTVARAGRGARVAPVQLPAPEPLEFTGRTVTLLRSWTGRSGARYEGLASIGLGSV
jgi:2'-5' RNA ligase